MLLHAVRSALLARRPTGDCVALLVRREDTETFLADCLADEPVWRDVLEIVEIEFALTQQLRLITRPGASPGPPLRHTEK